MGREQNIVNAVVLIVFLYGIYVFNGSLSASSERNDNYVKLVELIGNGENLDEGHQAIIAKYGQEEITNQNQKSPLCFIKAFYEIAVSKAINTQNLFTIFMDPNPEYVHITNCSQYYSLLMYRAQRLQTKVRNQVIPILEDLHKKIVEIKYPSQNKNAKMCVYFNSFNSQVTIKSQYLPLTNQNYKNIQVIIEQDASTDNSPMLIKYLMDTQTSPKPKYVQNKQRKGVLRGVKDILSQCEDNSIVVVLRGNEFLLGNNALEIIDRIFSHHQVDLAFFGTLSLPHMNIESVHSQKELAGQINPFFVFKKQLANGINFEHQNSQGIERNFLASELVKAASIKTNSIQVIKEALIYRADTYNGTLASTLKTLLPPSVQS